LISPSFCEQWHASYTLASVLPEALIPPFPALDRQTLVKHFTYTIDSKWEKKKVVAGKTAGAP